MCTVCVHVYIYTHVCIHVKIYTRIYLIWYTRHARIARLQICVCVGVKGGGVLISKYVNIVSVYMYIHMCV